MHLTQHYLRVNCAAGRAGVPVLVEHPADLVVARDEPATLRCEAAGEPQPSIVWLKDGQEVRTAPVDPTRYSIDSFHERKYLHAARYSHRVLLPNGALFFLRAVQSRREDDRGSYWCVASNSFGEAVSRRATLDIASKANSCKMGSCFKPFC